MGANPLVELRASWPNATVCAAITNDWITVSRIIAHQFVLQEPPLLTFFGKWVLSIVERHHAFVDYNAALDIYLFRKICGAISGSES